MATYVENVEIMAELVRAGIAVSVTGSGYRGLVNCPQCGQLKATISKGGWHVSCSCGFYASIETVAEHFNITVQQKRKCTVPPDRVSPSEHLFYQNAKRGEFPIHRGNWGDETRSAGKKPNRPPVLLG